jgi:hypothetical protein
MLKTTLVSPIVWYFAVFGIWTRVLFGKCLKLVTVFFGLEGLTWSVFSFVRSVSGLFVVQNVLAVLLRSVCYSFVIKKDWRTSWLLLYTLTFIACIYTLCSDYVRKVKTKKEIKKESHRYFRNESNYEKNVSKAIKSAFRHIRKSKNCLTRSEVLTSHVDGHSDLLRRYVLSTDKHLPTFRTSILLSPSRSCIPIWDCWTPMDTICHSTERIIPQGAVSQLSYAAAGQIRCCLVTSNISSKIGVLIVVKCWDEMLNLLEQTSNLCTKYYKLKVHSSELQHSITSRVRVVSLKKNKFATACCLISSRISLAMKVVSFPESKGYRRRQELTPEG